MFRAEVFDFFPAPGTSKAAGPDDPDGFADWAMDVFPALLEGDVPFYSHEIDAYWNDIGNLDELRQGNLDALHGAVAVEPGAPEIADGVRAASPLGGVDVSAPVLVGAGVELGEGARLEGPAIVGDGCRVGAGAIVRDSILLEGAEVPAKGVLVGGIAARSAKN
jgi:NDP-sugar pyrophosphorylase family protein